MHCKLLNHGVTVWYDRVIKPCCTWEPDSAWAQNNHVDRVDLISWHQTRDIVDVRSQLSQDSWSPHCSRCEQLESAGRQDSMRYNGNRAYADLQSDDIVLEIRPGSVCNFACQTCWPEASSRVADYYQKSGLIDIRDLDSSRLDDFAFLVPVASRIKQIILLGGEPFYDPSCRRFLSWAHENLTSDIIMFTNGSMIDWDWLKTYPGRVTLVFSLDAVGRAAEYIRFGTVWGDVWSNYIGCRGMSNIDTRVNITTSIYNYFYLENIIDHLVSDWPSVVSFGTPHSISHKGIDQSTFDERLVPYAYRPRLITSLDRVLTQLESGYIELGQKQNAQAAITHIVDRLHSVPFDHASFQTWHRYVRQMDRVKHINISDFCPELADILESHA